MAARAILLEAAPGKAATKLPLAHPLSEELLALAPARLNEVLADCANEGLVPDKAVRAALAAVETCALDVLAQNHINGEDVPSEDQEEEKDSMDDEESEGSDATLDSFIVSEDNDEREEELRVYREYREEVARDERDLCLQRIRELAEQESATEGSKHHAQLQDMRRSLERRAAYFERQLAPPKAPDFLAFDALPFARGNETLVELKRLTNERKYLPEWQDWAKQCGLPPGDVKVVTASGPRGARNGASVKQMRAFLTGKDPSEINRMCKAMHKQNCTVAS